MFSLPCSYQKIILNRSSFIKGIPVEPQLVSRSTSFVALRWTSNNSVTTNYTVEVKCCDEATWVEAQCPESLIGLGCTVADTMATVIGLRADTKYYFRVYAVYKNWKSAASTSSVEVKTKSRKTGMLQGIYFHTNKQPRSQNLFLSPGNEVDEQKLMSVGMKYRKQCQL